MSAYNPFYSIHIEGKRDGNVEMSLGFFPSYCEKVSNTEFDEVISIAKELQKTLKKLREVNSSQGQEQAIE